MIYKSKLNQIARQLQKGLAVMVLGTAVLTSCSPDLEETTTTKTGNSTETEEDGLPTTRYYEVAVSEETVAKKIENKLRLESFDALTKRPESEENKNYNNKVDSYNEMLSAYNKDYYEPLLTAAKEYDEGKKGKKNPMRKNVITFFGPRRTKYQNALRKKAKLEKLKEAIGKMDNEKKN